MASRIYEFSIDDAKIDPKTSTIRQVSLITLGEAKGHETKNGEQIWVDGTTLNQVFNCLTQMGSLKLKADHGSGVFSTAGWIDNFEKSGSKIIGELHVYESEPEKNRLFEIAAKNPDHLGLSLEFSGEDEVLGNKAFARCDEVSAVALVSEPAANSSLFSKNDEKLDKVYRNDRQRSMATKKNLDDATQAAGDPIAEMAKKFDEFCNKYNEDKAELDGRLKKFDDFLTNSDGKGNIDGDGRNIDPNVTPVVVNDDSATKKDQTKMSSDEKDEDMKDDDKKDDKVNKAAEMAANKAVREFAASLGIKQSIVSGVGKGLTDGKSSEKKFETLVTERTKELKGNKTQAMIECLNEFPAEYAEYRKNFVKVETKNTRTL